MKLDSEKETRRKMQKELKKTYMRAQKGKTSSVLRQISHQKRRQKILTRTLRRKRIYYPSLQNNA